MSSVDVWHDHDDWRVILQDGKDGLSEIYSKGFFVYGSSFDQTVADFSPWHTGASSQGVSYVYVSDTKKYAARFAGTDPTDSIWVQPSTHGDTMGKTVDGKSPLGFRAEVEFYVDDFNDCDRRTLFSNNLFDMYVDCTYRKIVAHNYADDPTCAVQTSTYSVAPDTWYKAVAWWDVKSKSFRTYLAPCGASVGCNWEEGQCGVLPVSVRKRQKSVRYWQVGALLTGPEGTKPTALAGQG